MPTIDVTDIAANFTMSFGYQFSSYVGSGSTFYSWETNGGHTITLTGTGITTGVGNLPTGGTITGMLIDLNGTAPSDVDVEISGIENKNITDIVFVAGPDSENTLWATVLDGDVTVDGAPTEDFRVEINTDFDEVSFGIHNGEDATIRGDFFGFTYFGGVQVLEGTAHFSAGETDFEGFIYWFNPAQTVRGNARLLGGDDTIIWTEDTRSYPSSYVYAYADASFVSGSAVVVGGDDLLDARNAGDGIGAFLVGDAYHTTAATAMVIGGDDILFGANASDGAPTNRLYGDVVVNFTDTLIAGDDTIYGRAGNDEIYGDTGSTGTNYIGGDDLIYGGSDGEDLMYGGRGNDRMYGGKGIVEMRGDQDNDKLYAGDGTTTAYGGSGDDLIKVTGDGEGSFYGGSGIDRISYYDAEGGITIDLGANTISRYWADDDTISNFENVSGSKVGNNKIFGTSGANDIDTYDGNDKVYGGGGGDKISLGKGNDYVKADFGANTYEGSSGLDTISYYNSNDGVIVDLKHNEAEGGYAEGDTISGFERLTGSTEDDKLYGSDGGNILKGGSGEDSLWGRDGNDKLYGGSNSDRFDGGEGNDKLYGGSGVDTFHFDKGDDFDTVMDFQNNADRIEIDGYSSGFDAFDYATQVGTDVVFNFGGGDGLIVENVLIGQLGNDLFVV
ncbi:Ca2+-binding protein, RTX toxin-related [Cognatiyoonia koreensis]|uniref:Ca2+-binding protein, RTX toxin-related n=1 Tax=Cognatiyoonia koreensis TaxID=364200 RepID=A0A1I0N188_9RHOB|nr:calcium-binding protein [Cognatiyoonia koreensis]SEV94571.1 Ca2+-binding protein, RTX toxin-related [Cognatiyoonia koreensis]